MVKQLIKEIINLIKKQKMNSELANKLQKEWSSILDLRGLAILTSKKTISLIKKCLEWFTQVFSYSLKAEQISLNLN